MKQLRFTTTKPMSLLGIFDKDQEPALVKPKSYGDFVMDSVVTNKAYIHGDAEELAGYDIPVFIDGNMGQLDLPIDQQDILMLLPSGEYKCKAEYCDNVFASNCYLITLK
jgi:hypothetical protein